MKVRSSSVGPSVSPEQIAADPVAAAIIRRKARQLVGRGGFGPSDRQDIEQDLLVDLLERLPSFDPEQSAIHVFVAMVVKRHAANLLRYGKAEKRDRRRECSLHKVVGHDEQGPVELGSAVTSRERDAVTQQARRDAGEAAEMALDVAELIERLPPQLRQLAKRLQTQTVSQAAREMRVPRTTLYASVRELRRRCEQVGLANYL